MMTESSAIPFATGSHQRQHLAEIIAAAAAAVAPKTLLANRLSLSPRGERLFFDGHPFPSVDCPLDLKSVENIVVVGGGKAAAEMAAGVEQLLGPARLKVHQVKGLISVPAGCQLPLKQIEVRETRPTGVNLPTPTVVDATAEMRAMLRQLGPHDLAIVLLTGGGSALLEAPAAGITLEFVSDITQRLSAQGADITSLNTIRQLLSRVKGGGLAAATTAGRLLGLVLSDVIGDPLPMIASGPCLPSTTRIATIAAILERHALPEDMRAVVLRLAQAVAAEPLPQPTTDGSWVTPLGCQVDHLLVGSNATALSAAATVAGRCGYEVVATMTDNSSATAEEVGRRLADRGLELLATACQLGRPLAMIEGGEATVQVPADHGSGGRNQQTVLAAAEHIAHRSWPAGLLLTSFGTDGEDGPTPAAGGVIDQITATALLRNRNQLLTALRRCDAYPLLNHCGGLIETGPTGTNVADLRLLLAHPTTEQAG
jgi:glycerate 2-kinase